jgi:hypothetical protein
MWRQEEFMRRDLPFHLTVAVSVGLCTAVCVFADQIFTDRTEFLIATGSDVTIDFESDPIGPVIGDPWLAQGIVFDEAGVGDNMAIADGGGAENIIYALGGQQADIDITLVDGTQAFGLGVFSNDIQDPGERIIFYGLFDEVLANVEMPLTGRQTTEFVGYLADQPIVRVEFVESDTDADYVGIGDVAFRSEGPIGFETRTWGQIKDLYR